MFKSKYGKKSVAMVGLAAMSMAAFTPVYAAEVPETKDTTKELDAVVTSDSAVVTTESVLPQIYEALNLETGKLYTRDATGKLVKLSDAEARAVNPLHDINVKRQSLIMDAISSGEWYTYYAFEATQAPYHYDLNEDGKVVPNKNYFGNLVATSHGAMIDARIAGDKETEQIWANDLKQTIAKYNAAPGMSVYIPQVNSNEADIEFYGIEAPDAEFFDSVYNNYDVRTKGSAEAKYWYENEYFLDNPDLFVEIVKSINTYSNLSFDTVQSIASGYDKAVEDRAKAQAEKLKAEEEKADKENDKKTKVAENTLITE